MATSAESAGEPAVPSGVLLSGIGGLEPVRHPALEELGRQSGDNTHRAIEELARSCDDGASGVMVLANVAGRSLTEDAFAPIWAEIDRRALPVLVHPAEPPGADLMDMGSYDLSWSVGFMFDTR
jgi:hypothetical protein